MFLLLHNSSQCFSLHFSAWKGEFGYVIFFTKIYVKIFYLYSFCIGKTARHFKILLSETESKNCFQASQYPICLWMSLDDSGIV